MFIKVNEVSKIYERSLANSFVTFVKRSLGLAGKKTSSSNRCVAVQGVSFEIREGERLGIIGANGAGKTTLLQMISGLADPTSGRIEKDGACHAVMQLGVGFREDLTGRENINLDGEIQGKSRSEIDKIAGEIIAFADLGEFIDQPLRVYSSGMKARLAFACLVKLEPEILIIDEALAVGDMEFSRKCSRAMREITSRGKILILVSHSMETIADMATRVIWLDQGRVIMDGHPREVTQAYLASVRVREEEEMRRKWGRVLRTQSRVSGLEIQDFALIDREGNFKLSFNLGEEIFVRFNVQSKDRIERPDFRFRIQRFDGLLIYENWAGEDGFLSGPIHGVCGIELALGAVQLGKNIYRLEVAVFDRDLNSGLEPLAESRNLLRIENLNYGHANPVFFPHCEWRVEEDKETLCK